MSLRRIVWTLALLVGFATSALAQPFPRPVLQFAGQVVFGPTLIVGLTVVNWSDYSPVLFAASPKLPPCGLNTSASRTWVDIYNARGQRLYGFCGFTDPSLLSEFWFSIPEARRPRAVYITLIDRLRRRIVVSNKVAIP
ncbi:hypothetical protein [uncultured Bradyrhizobium sp.]|jgi:hypothetical protein|uniref:hypothetical protein n=1 Tax=uncultured Bradyrhizobium sp. TaxID=199684 RepID=UPI002610DA83|nr:hypothetical protein [uncultured Bradyrhizobium sp.]